MLVPLELPPGLYLNGTDYQSRGRFYEAELCRWKDDRISPIGGWREKTATLVDGHARAILPWLDNSTQAWLGMGTETGLFVMTRSGSVYDVTPVGLVAGLADAVIGGGYGAGTYGTGIYGTPRPDGTNVLPAAVWSLDTWGEYLVGAFGTVIYEWTLGTGVVAATVSGAPSAEAMMVTEERVMMALGSDGDPRAVDWSAAEDNTDWTPTAINLAGGKRLQTSGRILTGRRVVGGGLIFTDVDVHRFQFIGLPQVYAFERLATGCGAVSKGAVQAIDARAFWMGISGFWTYNGGVQPLDCEVSGSIFNNINARQVSKVSAMHNSADGEIWWFYPSAASIECDRVVIYNYRENHWNDMTMARLSGTDRGVFGYPLVMGHDGTIYEHEVGQLRDGREPYALAGPVEIGDGARTMNVDGIIPDEQHLGEVSVSFVVRDWPMDDGSEVGPFTTASKTDCRFSGRSVAPKFTAAADTDFLIGRFRVDLSPGSGR